MLNANLELHLVNIMSLSRTHRKKNPLAIMGFHMVYIPNLCRFYIYAYYYKKSLSWGKYVILLFRLFLQISCM